MHSIDVQHDVGGHADVGFLREKGYGIEPREKLAVKLTTLAAEMLNQMDEFF